MVCCVALRLKPVELTRLWLCKSATYVSIVSAYDYSVLDHCCPLCPARSFCLHMMRTPTMAVTKALGAHATRVVNECCECIGSHGTALDIDQVALSPRFVAKICDIPQTRRRAAAPGPCRLKIYKGQHINISGPLDGSGADCFECGRFLFCEKISFHL